MPTSKLIHVTAFILLAAACAQNAPSEVASMSTTDWVEIESGFEEVPQHPERFAIRVPQGWQVDWRKGFELNISAEVSLDANNIWMHYGVDVPTLDPADEPEYEYIEKFETVNGANVRMVRPKGGSEGLTGAYFRRLHGESSPMGFVIYGLNLTKEQQRYVVTVARTVRSLE